MNRFGIRFLVGILVLTLSHLVAIAGVVIHVSPDGNDANDGSSWALAKRTIGAAISAAPSNPTSPTRIFIVGKQLNADGSVRFDGVYREWLTINAKHKVEIYGGFRGTEDTSTFDPDENDNRIGGQTVLDGASTNRCITASNSNGLVIRGMIIRNGYASTYGGGIILYRCNSFELSRCTLTGCATKNGHAGGGLYVSESSGLVRDVAIANCHTTSGGGGAYILSSNVTLLQVDVSGCTALFGGGLAVQTSFGQVANSRLANNEATGSMDGGGALYLRGSSQFYVRGCLLSRNRASFGAAIDLSGAACNVVSNSILTENWGRDGGAISVRDSQSLPDIFNCTLAFNVSENGAPAISVGPSAAIRLRNLVIAYNSGPAAAVCRDPSATLWAECSTTYQNESGNFNFYHGVSSNVLERDPKFFSTEPGFRDNAQAFAPLPDSPLIDSGLRCTTNAFSDAGRPRGLAEDQGAFECDWDKPDASGQAVILSGWQGDQNLLLKVPVQVSIYTEKGAYHSGGYVPQGRDGTFLLPGVDLTEGSGPFKVFVKAPGFLSKRLTQSEREDGTVILKANYSAGATVVLDVVGDVNGDDLVGSADITLVLTAFGSVQSYSNPRELIYRQADFDGNGLVDINDFLVPLLNFTKQGDELTFVSSAR